MFNRMAAALAAALVVGAASGALAGEITGAGSTFVNPVLSQWSSDYSKATGDHVNYQSIGSGGGIAQIKAGTVDFGASDKPLAPTELAQAGLAQFPVVIGSILPVVNIPGIEAGKLRFTGQLLAQIYLGEITKWNDPRIAAMNHGVALPNLQITVVHRSDGSGTTFNWTHYLSQVSPTWKGKVGEGTAVQWPAGLGGKGNEGVASFVKQTLGSIGYIEYAYVIQNHMAWGAVQNSTGRFVSPSIPAFQAAAATADWPHSTDFDLVITNAPGANSYPITATTFVLMYKKPKDAGRTAAALKFFKWALEKGQPQAAKLDYVSLPPALVKQVEGYWAKEIK